VRECLYLLISLLGFQAGPYLLEWFPAWGRVWRFISLSGGLLAVFYLEEIRAMNAGEDLESREHMRNLYKAGIIYMAGMILASLGGFALYFR